MTVTVQLAVLPPSAVVTVIVALPTETAVTLPVESTLATLLSELSECIPSPCGVEQETDGRELTLIIERWLLSLPDDDRILFMRRYWYGDSIKRLAAAYSSSPNKTAGRLYRLRVKLKSALEKEGVVL